MTTVYYRSENDTEYKKRLGKRLLVVLATVNPGRDTKIWCDILRDMLARSPRGRVYRSKIWSKNATGGEPATLIDTVCRELLEELEQHEQLPLFSSALLQEMGGSR